eukprot:jgi/Mesen1/3833/ME000207S02846
MQEQRGVKAEPEGVRVFDEKLQKEIADLEARLPENQQFVIKGRTHVQPEAGKAPATPSPGAPSPPPTPEDSETERPEDSQAERHWTVGGSWEPGPADKAAAKAHAAKGGVENPQLSPYSPEGAEDTSEQEREESEMGASGSKGEEKEHRKFSMPQEDPKIKIPVSEVHSRNGPPPVVGPVGNEEEASHWDVGQWKSGIVEETGGATSDVAEARRSARRAAYEREVREARERGEEHEGAWEESEEEEGEQRGEEGGERTYAQNPVKRGFQKMGDKLGEVKDKVTGKSNQGGDDDEQEGEGEEEQEGGSSYSDEYSEGGSSATTEGRAAKPSWQERRHSRATEDKIVDKFHADLDDQPRERIVSRTQLVEASRAKKEEAEENKLSSKAEAYLHKEEQLARADAERRLAAIEARHKSEVAKADAMELQAKEKAAKLEAQAEAEREQMEATAEQKAAEAVADVKHNMEVRIAEAHEKAGQIRAGKGLKEGGLFGIFGGKKY